jgi:hypothetical protein
VHDEYNCDANAHPRINVGIFQSKVAIKFVLIKHKLKSSLFRKNLGIKFHEDPFSRSRVVTYVSTVP